MRTRKHEPRLSTPGAYELFRKSFPEALDRHGARFAGDIVAWARKHFFIAPGRTIDLLSHQEALLRLFTSPGPGGRRPKNLIYSTIKKSGKTAIAALFTRHFAETGPPLGEIYCAANDLDQATNRVFQAVRQSIELDPVARKEWQITERELHFSNGTFIRALASDYKGEAGANPRLSVWTELWGFEHERMRRLFDELTPVPIQESFRLVETSAGYEGQSDLLRDLFELAREGKQMTAGELSQVTGASLGCFVEAPNPDSLVPVWRNELASLLVYWDEGFAARRMPWQQGEDGARYYAEQERTLRPSQFRRLHLNEWTQSEEAFVQIEWWDACEEELPELDDRTPLVLAVDGAVSGDCFAIAGVTRHPVRHDDVAVRLWGLWEPPSGGKIDFDEPFQELLGLMQKYNVVAIVYDRYQLEDFMQRLGRRASVWVYDFDQGARRNVADKILFDLIRDRRIAHCGPPEIRQHLLNANAKITGDSKMRIEKRVERLKVDLVVALAMAASECLRLYL
jgi:phage terminase large subunit-like protein